MTRNQNGFSVVAALVILSVVGLSVYVGFYVYHNDKPKQNMPISAVDPSHPTTKPNEPTQNLTFTVIKTDNESNHTEGYKVDSRRITLYLGSRSTGGYSYTVTKITKNSSQLEVFATEYTPGSGCNTTSSFSYPQVTVELNQTITEKINIHKTTVPYYC